MSKSVVKGLEQSTWLFSQSQTRKDGVSSSGDNARGYYVYKGIGVGEENSYAPHADEDKIEAFLIGNDLATPQKLREDYFSKIGMHDSNWKQFHKQKNQWVKGEDGVQFKETVLSVFEAARETSNLIHRAIALSLNLDEDYFVRLHNKADSNLELKHYHPKRKVSAPSRMSELIKQRYQSNASIAEDLDNDGAELRVKSHADLSSVTLLAQNDVDGLEILSSTTDGPKWISAPYIPNTILINTGDCMERWTNGIFKSTKHRVVRTKRNSELSRYSIVYFCMPNWEAEVNVIPELRSKTSVTQPEKSTLFGDLTPFV